MELSWLLRQMSDDVRRARCQALRPVLWVRVCLWYAGLDVRGPLPLAQTATSWGVVLGVDRPVGVCLSSPSSAEDSSQSTLLSKSNLVLTGPVVNGAGRSCIVSRGFLREFSPLDVGMSATYPEQKRSRCLGD